MKNVIYKLIILLSMSVKAFSESENSFPCETACIQLEGAEREWRELSRSVTKEKGLVTLVQCDLLDESVMELISIEYCDVSAMQGVEGFSFDLLIEAYNETIDKNSNVISKKCIGKTRNEFVEEVLLKDVDGLIIHEINRCVLTDSTFHRVHYSSKAMNPEKRTKWLNILTEHTSIVPYKEAYGVKGISLVDRFSKSIALGGYFSHWVEIDTWTFENGYTMAQYCPVPEDSAPVGEILEVISVCNFSDLSMDKFFDLAKKTVSSKTKTKVSFDVLESTPTEMIFKYKYPLETHMLNVVVRTVLTARGYYSFSYKLALTGDLSDKDVAEMVAKLKAIKVEE